MGILNAGTAAPDFSLPDLRGRIRTLAELLESGPALLCFYKIECPTCALAFPYLQRFHERFAPHLSVVGIAQNAPDEIHPFLAEHRASFPQVIDDPFYFTSTAYGLDFTPTLFLVEPDGRIEAVIEAWQRDALNDLAARVAERLDLPIQPIAGEDAPARRPG